MIRVRRLRVYLAAPFFSEAEREFNSRLLHELECHWDVFYPYRDGIRMAELIAEGVDLVTAAKRVWLCDADRVRDSDVILAVLDGRVPDEGVCVELGLASGMGKFVVGLYTDARSCFPWGANPMITGCLASRCESVQSVVATLQRYSQASAAPQDVASDE